MIQSAANPLLKMPPGYPVEKRSSVGLSDAMAARPGGSVPAAGNWERPEKLMPTMPILWLATHGWCAMVCTASYVS